MAVHGMLCGSGGRATAASEEEADAMAQPGIVVFSSRLIGPIKNQTTEKGFRPIFVAASLMSNSCRDVNRLRGSAINPSWYKTLLLLDISPPLFQQCYRLCQTR